MARGPIVDLWRGVSDEELLIAAAQEDRKAWRVLFERYARRLTAFAQSIVKDEALADEVVADVFYRLSCAAKERRVENAGAWLFTVTRRQALNARRRELRLVKRREAFSKLPIAEPFHAQDKLKDIVSEARLDDEQTALLEMKVHGFSNQEIANYFVTPVGTVKSRFNTITEKLRAHFQRPRLVKPQEKA